MKKPLIAILVLAAVVMIPSLALGEVCPPVDVNLNVSDEPTQTWWMVLLDFLVQLSAPLITTILGVLGTWVVRKLARKWDAEKQEAVIRLTDNLLTAGVAFAEEQARKALRTDSTKTEGAAKLQTAVDFIQGQLDQSNLPTIAEAELKKLIEARVMRERARPDGVIPSDTAPCENGDAPKPLTEDAPKSA